MLKREGLGGLCCTGSIQDDRGCINGYRGILEKKMESTS